MDKKLNYAFYIKLFTPIVLGLLLYFISQISGGWGLSSNAWLFTSIFIAMIIGMILEPVPAALISLTAITVAAVFKVGPAGSGAADAAIKAPAAINWAISGFSDAVVMLIFIAFTIGLGVQKTGLGRRIALFIVAKLGNSTLGLGYAIAITDGILAPFIPSNAARSGGSVYPITAAIAQMFDSTPDNNPRKIGSYLIWVGVATCCVSSSIFLTGQAPNPLAISLVSQAGVRVVDWTGWVIAFAPVGIILFLITPLLCYIIYPPEIKGSKEVVKWANEEKAKLGKLSVGEIFMTIIALIGLTLWVGASYFNINATTTAFIVTVLMFATRVITWQDFLGNKPAFNTYIWFGTIVAMAAGLKNVGYLTWAGDILGVYLADLDPFWAMMALLITFSAFRYFFASGTAFVTAMMAIYVTIASAVPNLDVAETMLIIILPMGFMGIITPYGTGCSPLWYGSNYIKGPAFFKLGAIFAIIFMAVYMIVGIPWIKFIMPHLTLI